MGGERFYPDPDEDPLDDDELTRDEAAPLGEEETPPGESRILPQGYDDHDMPTRQIARLDPSMLDETRISASMPDDLPQEDEDSFVPDRYTPDEPDDPGFPADDEAAGAAFPAHDPFGEDTVIRPGYDPAYDEVTRAVPSASRPPGTQAVPPTRSYTEDPLVSPPAAPPPPVYGGFEDRPPVGAPPADDRRRRRRTARERRDSGLYFPWWSLLVLLGGVALVATLIVMALGSLGGRFSPGGETPVIIVVTSTPTRAPTDPPVSPTPRLPTPTPTSALNTPETPGAALEETPGSAITPAPEQLEVRIGAEIEVFDVGTAGLNVRGGAGTGFPVVLIAAEGSRFEVIGGPEAANDFTWWQLRSLDNPTIEGWGVADFLRVPQD